MKLLPFVCLGCAALLPGCAAPMTCRIAVSNMSTAAVSNVVLQSGEVTQYTAPRIPAKTSGRCVPPVGAPPRATQLSWTDDIGQTHRKELRAPFPLPDDFAGRIVFQIDGPGSARMFVLPDDPDRFSSDMPWAKPEKWEGHPNIPGLTRE